MLEQLAEDWQDAATVADNDPRDCGRAHFCTLEFRCAVQALEGLKELVSIGRVEISAVVPD